MMRTIGGCLVVVILLMLAVSVMGQNGGEADLAKATQNPVSDLISVPFQNNMNFRVGPDEELMNVLNIKPAWPFSVNEDWNLITRTILPIISHPGFGPDDNGTTGLGDVIFRAFLSPSESGELIWGAGPVFSLPLATEDVLGSEKWGVGPTAVALTVNGPWVYGALFQSIWSFAGEDDRADVNEMLLQPFVNFNMPGGWYLVSSPVITANWKADSDDTWTLPVGGGVGKIFRIGELPLKGTIQGYYNLERPEYAAESTLRLQLQFLFPK
jgi:hypothetical protein